MKCDLEESTDAHSARTSNHFTAKSVWTVAPRYFFAPDTPKGIIVRVLNTGISSTRKVNINSEKYNANDYLQIDYLHVYSS